MLPHLLSDVMFSSGARLLYSSSGPSVGAFLASAQSGNNRQQSEILRFNGHFTFQGNF
jgi:hypothetical protein